MIDEIRPYTTVYDRIRFIPLVTTYTDNDNDNDLKEPIMTKNL